LYSKIDNKLHDPFLKFETLNLGDINAIGVYQNYHPGSIKVLVVNSLHFMKKLFIQLTEHLNFRHFSAF